jgi:hypothetical protein
MQRREEEAATAAAVGAAVGAVTAGAGAAEAGAGAMGAAAQNWSSRHQVKAGGAP